MVLGEGALAGQGGHHRGLQELGQLDQLVGGLGVEDALAGLDDGALGGQQGGGGAAHVGRVGLLFDGAGRLVVEKLLGQFGGGDVGRDFQQHGAGASAAELGEGAAHHGGDALDHVEFIGPLGDGLVAAGGVEVGMDAALVAGHAGGQQEDGHRLGVGLGDAAEAVFSAGAVLHHEDANLLAVGGAGVAVHHVNAGDLLAEDHRADSGDGGSLQQRLVGHAGDELHALHPQYVGDCGNSIHLSASPITLHYVGCQSRERV